MRYQHLPLYAALLFSLSCTGLRSAPVTNMTESNFHQRGTVASADGTQIVYETHGRGPFTLLLIHGWTCDRSYWRKQIEPLSADFQVITVDLAGHGESSAARTQWTMAAFGEDVAAVANKLDARNVVIVGHSMGGPVMLEAARRMPQRVRALVGVDTLKNPDEAITPEQADELWGAFAGNFSAAVEGFVRRQFFLPQSDPAIVNQIATDMAAAPPALSIAAGKNLSVYDRRAALEAVAHLPLTLINAPIPPTQPDKYHSVHDNMTLIVMDQAGHFPMQEVPNLFNKILKNTVLKTP
ncbi:MAG: alpha/beta fold hydrolase [Gammaproteobacteria bacterium]